MHIPLGAGLMLLLSLSSAGQGACGTLNGTKSLLDRRPLEFVLVGEIHGSVETPADFARLVCLVLYTKQNVIVALERPVSEQPFIEQLVMGENSPANEASLLTQPGWGVFDGRSSVAMLDLIRKLGELHASYPTLKVACFDPAAASYSSPGERDRLMAENLLRLHREKPSALVVALTGNLHARSSRSADFGNYEFTAMYLPHDGTITLLVTSEGGQFWVNNGTTCGPTCELCT